MTRFLIDTHALIWWLSDPSQLAPDAFDAIINGKNAIYLSAAAAWEMSIKKSIGKLNMPANLEEVLLQEHIELLPIKLPHALATADLPLHHQDPFDRMQVAQARHESMILITRDARIMEYDVDILQA